MATSTENGTPVFSQADDGPHLPRHALPSAWRGRGELLAGAFAERWLRGSRVLSSDYALSLADQAIVSGTSFVTTVLVARYGNAGELGVYAVGISLLITLMALHDSLILQPYTIQRHSVAVSTKDHIGACLILSFLFSGLCLFGLALLSSGVLEWRGASDGIIMTFTVAAAVPFVMTREFVRRVAIARLEMRRAIILDVIVSVTQLGVLGWLSWIDHMSAVTACIALAAASGVATVASLYWGRMEFALRTEHVPEIFGQAWSLGKWLVLGRITVQVQGVITYWITIIVAGAAVTGVYAACVSVVNVINPVLFALTNVMVPKLVLSWKSGGVVELRQATWRNTLLISAIMIPFVLAIALGGDFIMRYVYGGDDFAGQSLTLTLLALAALAAALGMPPSSALATMERPRAIVVVGALSAILCAASVAVFLDKWGLQGAACGLVLANVVGAAGRWILLLRVPAAACDWAQLMTALQGTAYFAEAKDISVKRIGGGEQADAFLIKRNETHACDDDRERKEIVVKLYKPEMGLTVDRVAPQFESLSALHALLDGREFKGWTIAVPRPLRVCRAPLAFVMTWVPGDDIDAYTSRGDVGAELLNDAAEAFATAMEWCWASGRRHGDLGLRNVLFDLKAKKISLIDVGTRESCRTCSETDKFRSPVVSDLAHVLCDAVRDVMVLVGNTPARMGKEMLVQNVVRTILNNVHSPSEKRRLVNDIWSCLLEHLDECLEPSWSPRGISHRFVRNAAIRRARTIIESATCADCEVSGPAATA